MELEKNCNLKTAEFATLTFDKVFLQISERIIWLTMFYQFQLNCCVIENELSFKYISSKLTAH
jgi:hypothetical protein